MAVVTPGGEEGGQGEVGGVVVTPCPAHDVGEEGHGVGLVPAHTCPSD